MRPVRSCFYFLAALTWLCAACGSREAPPGRGGVAISFDDRFIEDWYRLRPVFNEFGAKVTFYINGDTLTLDEAEMLRQLERDGHEIGFHGTIHGDAKQLLELYGVEGYWSMEIEPGLSYFRRLGFNPTSYAHPGGTSAGRTDSALLANGFVTLRDVSKAERYFRGVRLYHLPPSWMPHIYYGFDNRKSLFALEIDRGTVLSVAEMRKALEKAKKEGKVLMLFGHQPLPDNPPPGLYGFDKTFLINILEESRRLGLRFYTMSELR